MAAAGGPYGILVEAPAAVRPSGRGYDRAVKYEVIIYWSEEDGAFIAEVPELPGCMADGATKADALSAVERVAQAWIETANELGRPVPKPQGRLKSA